VTLVLDTNVLLAGLLTRGVCEALLDVCLGDPGHRVFTSEAILGEFADKAEIKFRIPASKVQSTVETLRRQMAVVLPAPVDAAVCRDPADLMVLGTLLAADADCLVTGDKELLVLERFAGHPIFSPRQCLERLLLAPPAQ
jgi:putative PIN family toxin of toxin-antitoxin system